MNTQRYIEIDSGLDNLTSAEIENGWHFCPDWDDMLIWEHEKEGKHCTCEGFELND